MKLFQNKKFKYGSLAVALTAGVIALVILLNAAVSLLADRFYWYADMTSDRLYEISDLSRTLLSTVEERCKDGREAKIVFMGDEDKIQSTSNNYMKQIYELARKYESEFDFIKVDCIDPDLHPDRVKKYLQHSENAVLNESDVVFEGPDGQYKIVNYKTFLTVDSESGKVFAFSGERKITTTLLSLVSNNTTAYLTTGHGENTAALTEFKELLSIVGFKVEEIDLQKQDLDPEKGRLVVVCSPKTDFWGVTDSVNELKKLDDFLDGFGHLMVFLDSEYVDKMSNLRSLLADWGIHYNADLITEGAGASMSVDGRTISATYPTEGSGASLHASIRGLDSVPKTVFSDTCTIKIKDVTTATTYSKYATTPVLTTSPDATALDIATGETRGAPGEPVMVLGMEERILDSSNGSAYDTYVLACGSSDFISDAYLQGGYANKDILYSALRAMVVDNVDISADNINFREYKGEALDITTGEANGNMILIAAVLPVLILAVGTVVFIRRRYL